MKEKVLVTGGAGFIGSHIVDRCIEQGHDVVVVDDLSTGCRENLNPKAAFYEMDIQSEGLSAVFAKEQPSLLMHLAAQMNVTLSVKDPLFDARSNIVGSVNVLENCVRHKVRRFIYASTGGAVYGEPENLPASEECPPKPICHYGVSKYTVEHYIELYKHLYGLEYVILRFPNVYGPRQNPKGEAGVCAILTTLMRDGKQPTLYGNGEPVRDYVYVGDIARGVVTAIEKGEGWIINLGSGRGTTVQEIFDTLKGLMGFQGEPILEPLRPGEVFQIYTTGDRAAAILDWRPEIDLTEGLRRTADFICEKQ